MLDDKIAELKAYGIKNNIPIIEDGGLKVLLKVLDQAKPKRILELGTAIGYSALLMYQHTNADIISIERDESRYNIAKEVVEKLDLTNQIQLIFDDALYVDSQNWGLFDVIYFDAAKAQNKAFLKKYNHNLKVGGIIVIDNLFFHGIVKKKQEEIESRNMRQLSRKINDFINYVKNLDGYRFDIIEQGDGIGILYKEKDVEI